MTGSMEFCNTTVANVISNTIEQARLLGANAAVDGPAGIGKTFALSRHNRSVDGTAMLTATAASGNAARNLFSSLCATLHLRTNGSIADMQHSLFSYDRPGFVVIVDEAQNLNLQSIRELLTLYDRSHMTVVFCGNADVIKKTRVDKGPLATIGSRIHIRRTLTGIVAEDVDAICGTFDVEGGEALALMRRVGRHSQARGVSFILRAARELADGKAIKAAHIKQIINEFPQYRPAEN